MGANNDLVGIFGKVVRENRVKENISQEKLAEQTGLHRSYISDVERGTRNITIKNVFKICGALNKRPSRIFKQIEETIQEK